MFLRMRLADMSQRFMFHRTRLTTNPQRLNNLTPCQRCE
jgi:hypothetical protein